MNQLTEENSQILHGLGKELGTLDLLLRRCLAAEISLTSMRVGSRLRSSSIVHLMEQEGKCESDGFGDLFLDLSVELVVL